MNPAHQILTAVSPAAIVSAAAAFFESEGGLHGLPGHAPIRSLDDIEHVISRMSDAIEQMPRFDVDRSERASRVLGYLMAASIRARQTA